jgi:flagellar basal-body rod protein FlgC
MDFLSALHISASGLAAERERVDLATSNLANAETTRGPDGQPYRRLDPVLQASPFESTLQAGEPAGAQPMEVQVTGVAVDQTPGRRVYSPGHPDADAQGFVTLPNVNPVHEVVNLISAQNAYQANAAAIETLKTMAQQAIAIGK